MIDYTNLYIDWPMLSKEVEWVQIVARDNKGKLLGVVKDFQRPVEQTISRCNAELEVRRSYRMHPARIRKFTDATLINLLEGCGKKVKIQEANDGE